MKRVYFLFILLAFPCLSKVVTLEDEAEITRASEISRMKASESAALRERLISKIQVPVKSEHCVAYHIYSGTCLVSYHKFNSRLVTAIPDSMEYRPDSVHSDIIPKIRESVMGELLEAEYLRSIQLDTGMDGSRKRPLNDSTDIKGVDRNTLLEAVRLFPDAKVQIFAASDSAWLAKTLMDSSHEYLPVTQPMSNLNDSVLLDLAERGSQSWTPIRNIQFGYLTASLINPLPLDEAIAYLGSLTGDIPMERELALDDTVDAVVLHDPGRCREPDTFQVLAKLVPPRGTKAQDNESGFPAWLNFSSNTLPSELLDLLVGSFQQPQENIEGPVRAPYGIWSFQLQDHRLGKQIPEGECRDRIRKEIISQWKRESLLTGFREKAQKRGSKELGAIYSDFIRSLKNFGNADPVNTYKRLRTEWIAGNVRLTYVP